MDERTKEALKKSITHWENIVNGEEYDSCALCTKFRYCEKCIISKQGYDHCNGTPYEELLNHINKEHVPFNPFAGLRIHCEKCKEIAQKEVDFLKSFLPDENGIRHYYLYAKNWYRVTNYIDDLKIISEHYTGIGAEFITIEDIISILSGIVQDSSKITTEQFIKKIVDNERCSPQLTINEHIIYVLLSTIRYLNSIDVPFALGEPDKSILPLKDYL